MANAVLCPRLNSFLQNPPIVTIDDVKQPRLSTYDRTAGTSVDLYCPSPTFGLQPNNTRLVCQNSGQWDKAIPTCIHPSDIPDQGFLSEEQKIIVGVAGGVGGLVLIILAVLLIAIFRMKSKAKKKRNLASQDGGPSVGNMYALDNKAFVHDRTLPPYPPSYASRDIYDPNQLEPKRNIALPPMSSGHNVYKNYSYLDDPRDRGFISPREMDEVDYARERSGDYGYPSSRQATGDVMSRRDADYRYQAAREAEYRESDRSRGIIATRGLQDVHQGGPIYQNREDVLDIIARERMDQLAHDRQRFPTLDPYSKRNPKSSEAVARAERTLQYVEEHSSRSPTPLLGHARRMENQTQVGDTSGRSNQRDIYSPGTSARNYREGRPSEQYDQGRASNLYGQGRSNDPYGQGRVDDLYAQVRRPNEFERSTHYQARSERNIYDREPPQDYQSYGGPVAYDDPRQRAGGHPDPYGYPDPSPLWRPKTKTHFTGKRTR